MERYIKEYASAKMRDVKNNDLMHPEEQEKKIRQINKALFFRKQGWTTADETMKIILEA